MELPEARVETNIARVQQAESYRAVILNEIGAQLGFSDGKNSGLLRLVADAAEALAPGGVLIVADYGHPKAAARLDSVSFADLMTQAAQSGLRGRVVPLWEVLDLDVNAQALSTTRASFPPLQAMFAQTASRSRAAPGCGARSSSSPKASWISPPSTVCSGRRCQSARWGCRRRSSGRWRHEIPAHRPLTGPRGEVRATILPVLHRRREEGRADHVVRRAAVAAIGTSYRTASRSRAFTSTSCG